jgi:hypothetical protein
VYMDYQGTSVMGSPVERRFLGAVVGHRFDSVGCLLRVFSLYSL